MKAPALRVEGEETATAYLPAWTDAQWIALADTAKHRPVSGSPGPIRARRPAAAAGATARRVALSTHRRQRSA
jgi:hypothetical protein